MNNMNWLLIVTAIVLLLSAIVGYIRGFIKITVSIATTIATIALVVFLNPYVSDLVMKYTPLDDMVESKVESTIGDSLGGEDGAGLDFSGIDLSGTKLEGMDLSKYSLKDLKKMGITQEQINDVLKKADIPKSNQIALIEKSGMPDLFKNLLKENNNSAVYSKLGVQSFGEYIGKYIAKLVVNIVSFLITFLFAIIIVRAVVFALAIVENLPVVGGINRAAGAVMGVVITVIIVWLFYLVVMLGYSTAAGKICMEQINQNAMLKYLFEHNMLLRFVIAFR